MKIFMLKILLAAVPFLALFTYIEIRARQLPNTYRVKSDHFRRLKDSVEILVLGSSHALKGIDPSCFSCTGFNFSNSSQTLIHDAGICLRFLDDMPRLKAVVLDISAISYFFSLQDSPESWRDYFYWHYYGLTSPSVDFLKPEAYLHFTLYTRRIVNDIFFGKLDAGREFGNIGPYGWEPRAPGDPAAISDSTGFRRVKLHEALALERNFPKVMKSLDGMLRELGKRGIPVIMVSLPVSPTYSAYLDPAREKRNREISDSIAAKYKILYRDYSRDPRFGEGDFSDNDHLSATGAQKFSRILDREMMIGAACGKK